MSLMKRTTLKSGPWRKYTQVETVKLKKKLDTLFSALIRERDKDLPCIDLCGKDYPVKQCGHFRRRELMSTRWNPKNSNGQNMTCNYFASRSNDIYRHSLGIDERWGAGMSKKIYQLSEKQKQWTGTELESLISAAKQGYEGFYTKYYEICPE